MILIGGVVVLILGGLFVYSTFLVDDESADSTTTTAGTEFTYGTTECAPVEPPAEPVLDYQDAFQDCLDPDKEYTAVFDTSEGEIRVQLHTASTPGTVNNFVNLARNGYYDGTRIFRTDPAIEIIQGGSPHTQDNSDPGPGYTIPDEGSGYTYSPGQLVMARSTGPDSASAQYFFVAGEAAASLDADGTYVVFGNTNDAGLEVVQSILALNEGEGQLGGAPSREVTVNSVRIVERDAEASGSTTTTAAP
jgi:cyclophilin family peptidyl-prolyl cis-trans isomerase